MRRNALRSTRTSSKVRLVLNCCTSRRFFFVHAACGGTDQRRLVRKCFSLGCFLGAIHERLAAFTRNSQVLPMSHPLGELFPTWSFTATRGTCPPFPRRGWHTTYVRDALWGVCTAAGFFRCFVCAVFSLEELLSVLGRTPSRRLKAPSRCRRWHAFAVWVCLWSDKTLLLCCFSRPRSLMLWYMQV